MCSQFSIVFAPAFLPEHAPPCQKLPGPAFAANQGPTPCLSMAAIALIEGVASLATAAIPNQCLASSSFCPRHSVSRAPSSCRRRRPLAGYRCSSSSSHPGHESEGRGALLLPPPRLKPVPISQFGQYPRRQDHQRQGTPPSSQTTPAGVHPKADQPTRAGPAAEEEEEGGGDGSSSGDQE